MRLSSLILAVIFGSVKTLCAADSDAGPTPLLLRTSKPAATQPADSEPTLTPWLPDAAKATGTAIVICPGGGYGGLAMDHEGRQVAEWLNGVGVAAFVLKYRHQGTGFGHPAPMQDVQRAIQTVRSRAREWNIRPDRIGVLGFSAGGHLASTAGTHFIAGRPDAEDVVERVSSRPDFMVLIYPVISMVEPYAHRGSRKNLLGPKPAPELVEAMSSERQVTAETPPAFLVHTNEDAGVPSENSIAFYLALRKAKVPAEMHIFEKGKHGFGLGKPGMPAAKWPKLCETWMRERGWLEP